MLGSPESGTLSHCCGGSLPSGLYWQLAINQANAASIAPAAPKVWPVDGLVEVQRVAAKYFGNGSAFHAVVVLRAGAVQIDPADVFRFQTGFIQSGLKGLGCTQTIGAGRRHMVGIAACTIAEQLHFAVKIGIARHHEKCGRFADIDAVAVGGKGLAMPSESTPKRQNH